MLFTPTSRKSTTTALAATLVAVSLLAGACATSEAATPDEPGIVEVTLADYKFESVPASVPAGTKFTVANESVAELHEMVVVPLADDETRTLAELKELPMEELFGIVGEPAAVLLAPPGGEQIAAVGDGTVTEPGRYLVVCVIPTGVEPQVYLEAAAKSNGAPPQVEGGPPHLMNGMMTEVVVE